MELLLSFHIFSKMIQLTLKHQIDVISIMITLSENNEKDAINIYAHYAPPIKVTS